MPKDFKGVMHEWGQGKLHSGSKKGPVVGKKKQNQAVAIAFSEDRKLKGKRAHDGEVLEAEGHENSEE